MLSCVFTSHILAAQDSGNECITFQELIQHVSMSLTHIPSRMFCFATSRSFLSY